MYVDMSASFADLISPMAPTPLVVWEMIEFAEPSSADFCRRDAIEIGSALRERYYSLNSCLNPTPLIC